MLKKTIKYIFITSSVLYLLIAIFLTSYVYIASRVMSIISSITLIIISFDNKCGWEYRFFEDYYACELLTFIIPFHFILLLISDIDIINSILIISEAFYLVKRFRLKKIEK